MKWERGQASAQANFNHALYYLAHTYTVKHISYVLTSNDFWFRTIIYCGPTPVII